jgi:transcriptional regulator with XRE-family HTH domain
MNATTTGATVSERIRRRLIDLDKTQAALAREVGMRDAKLSRRMCGDVEFRADELTRIAEALDMPVAELLDEEGDR